MVASRLILQTCYRILFLLLSLLPVQAVADPLALDECLARARERNPALQTSRLDISIAEEAIRQADAALFPRIDAQIGYTSQLEAQAMKANNQLITTQQPNYLFGNLNFQYTLYDFGRRDARRSASRTGLDAVRLEVRQQEQDVSLQVIETYFAILEAQKVNAAVTEELKTVTEHRRVALALYEEGSATRNDLLQAEVRLANVRQLLLTRLNQLENLYLRLNFMTGSPASDRPQLSEPATPVLQQAPPGGIRSVQKRPDLCALGKGIEIREQEIRESRTAFYPELFTRLSLDYLENDKLREQAIYGASVGIRINLFDGFGSTATRNRAVALQARAREQLRLAEEQARLEVDTASNDLRVAFERIAVTRESIRQGEENLRINRNRYEERVGTATEVLDAQTLLTQARTEHYRAQYDYQRAAARLSRATGEL